MPHACPWSVPGSPWDPRRPWGRGPVSCAAAVAVRQEANQECLGPHRGCWPADPGLSRQGESLRPPRIGVRAAIEQTGAMLRQRNEGDGATGLQRQADRKSTGWFAGLLRRSTAGGLCATAVLLAGCGMPTPYVPLLENPKDGRTFYLSPRGDDSDDGRTPKTAWRTLRRADALRFKPGDRLRLEAGARFPGGLSVVVDVELGDHVVVAVAPVVVEVCEVALLAPGATGPGFAMAGRGTAAAGHTHGVGLAPVQGTRMPYVRPPAPCRCRLAPPAEGGPPGARPAAGPSPARARPPPGRSQGPPWRCRWPRCSRCAG